MDKLIKILYELHPDIDYQNKSGLIDNNILDSLDIVMLITEINDKFDVSIPPSEITYENFNSVNDIKMLIEKLDGI